MTDFSVQFRKIIIRYKRIGYNLNVTRQSACLVINPIRVDGFAALFICTPVDRASDFMMVCCLVYQGSTDYLLFVNPKFHVSSRLVWLYSPVCVGPGRKPRDRFSHNEAHISLMIKFRCLE